MASTLIGSSDKIESKRELGRVSVVSKVKNLNSKWRRRGQEMKPGRVFAERRPRKLKLNE